jgi:hypothetical protein
MQPMTKEQARAFKERWTLVNRVISEEIRTTPAELKARQIATLFLAADALDLVADEEPFARWQSLRERYNVRRA